MSLSLYSLYFTLLPRPHNTFELQHTKEEVATKIERQSRAQRGPPPPRRVQEQVRNTHLTVPAIFQLPQAGRGAHRSDPALNPGPGPQRSKGCGLARGHTLAGLVVHWRGWCGPFSSLALACLLRQRVTGGIAGPSQPVDVWLTRACGSLGLGTRASRAIACVHAHGQWCIASPFLCWYITFPYSPKPSRFASRGGAL